MATYNKSQLVGKGNIRRIVIEYDELDEPLVVLDGAEADEFIADWHNGLPAGEKAKLKEATDITEPLEIES